MAPDNPEKSMPKTPATLIALSLALLIPPLALLRAAPLSRLLPLRGGEICFSLFPCSGVGTRNGQRNVCIPTQERGNEKIRPCTLWPAPSMAPDNPEKSMPKTPATLIAFSLALLVPPLALLRAAPLSRLLPLRGGEICFSLFPCSGVGTRNGQRNVCIPTQERGNEKIRPCTLWPAPSMAPDNPEKSMPKTPATLIALSLALLIPPLALLRATPLSRLLPLRGGEICFSLFPCSGVGTRNGQRNVCIPTQERGNEKLVWPAPSMAPDNPEKSMPKTPATLIALSLALLIPPLALLRAAPLPRLLPLRGGRDLLLLVPMLRRGNKKRSA